MRLVHISDLHLGYRQFQRVTQAGINQREADVAAVFRRAVDAILELRPDVVLMAGDIFHTVRPPNPAILHTFAQLSRLTAALPEAAVVMIAGNHDTPRSSETGCILRLFRQVGVTVVDGESKRLHFPEKDLSVLCVPDTTGQPRTLYHPEAGCRYNVLLLHGELRGIIPHRAMSEDRPTLEIDPAELHISSWHYVALGHYHVYREIAPNAYYSGSIEYTSSNPWGELREERELGIPGKGFIEFDLDSGARHFHHVPPAREFVDLESFSARGLTSLEVDERIRDLVEGTPGGIEDKVVRLVIRDVPRHIARELDHAAIRGYKRRALNFTLDTRRPEVVRVHGQGAPARRRSLEETVRDKLHSRILDSDINRTELVELGIGYLREAEASATAGAEAEG